MVMADKIRIKKYQQPKVKQWAEILEIPEPKFLEDAINFYLRFLEGKPQNIQNLEAQIINPQSKMNNDAQTIEDLDNFTGGIEL